MSQIPRSSARALLPLAALSTLGLALLCLTLLGLAAGCDRSQVIQVQTTPEPQGGMGLVPGERVVARHGLAFREGTVITVQGRLVTVAWDDPPPERSYLPRQWVRSLERPAAVRRGQWALCRPKAGASWELCRIDDLRGDQALAALTGDGASWKLARRRTQALPAGLHAWAEEHGSELLEQSRRKQALERSRPASAGQAVKAGQTVLAEWTRDSWWEARVLRIEAAEVVVSWVDGGGEQRVQPTQVAPPGGAAQLAAGALAFCKWSSTSQWWQAWIERLSDTAVQVTFRNGQEAVLTPSHCAPASVDASADAPLTPAVQADGQSATR